MCLEWFFSIKESSTNSEKGRINSYNLGTNCRHKKNFGIQNLRGWRNGRPRL